MDKKKILLVDGNSLLFRAFYASSYTGTILTTTDGIPTNAIYSFANMITSLLTKEDYYDVKVAFDKGKHTFRHDKLEDYKGGRKATPQELVEQFPLARELLESMNISFYEMDGIEADDLIGTMAKKINDDYPNYVVHVLTSDKDMFQLINDHTLIELPKSGTSVLEEFGAKELYEKWEISPSQVPDLKGIMGDPSDNLKGVAGVGEKGAIKLIKQYGSIEEIYEHIDELKGAQQRNMINGKDDAFLCKDLATIRTNIYIEDFEIRKLSLTINPLIDFLNKYEMYSLTKRYTNSVEKINNEEKIEYEIISQWSKKYESKENFIFVESLDLNYHDGKVIGISISNEKGNFYLNYAMKKQLDIFSINEDDVENFDSNLDEFLKSKDINKNTYDIKRTVALLENMGFTPDFDSFTYDMMSIGYILNPSVTSTFANHLRLISKELNIEDDEVVYGKGVKQNPDIELKIKAEFISKKAYYISKIKELSLKQIEDNDLMKLYKDIDFKLIKVLRNMEINGVLIDRNELIEQTKNAELKMNNLEMEIKNLVKDLVEDDFNLQSPKQIKELLYTKMQLPNMFKGSTNKEALESLVQFSDVPNLILEHRKWAKLYSTYLAGFEKYIKKNNRVHTIYNQNLTATGRLSSIEPNLQNISIRDDDQKEIRKMFIADKGFTFYSFDYSQIELRVMAEIANEQHMLDIFNENGDIHKASAMKIFNLTSQDEVTDNMRRIAKVFNFGIIYGLSDFGLAKDLNISIPEAKTLIKKYYETFPGIKSFKDKEIEFATKHGFVETLSKRRRYIPELRNTSYHTRQFGERIAVNMPIQGTAADILKIAMINIFDKFNENNLLSNMCSQIHDEIIFSIKNGEEKIAVSIIKEEMSKAFKDLGSIYYPELVIKVPLLESESNGNNWFELK